MEIDVSHDEIVTEMILDIFKKLIWNCMTRTDIDSAESDCSFFCINSDYGVFWKLKLRRQCVRSSRDSSIVAYFCTSLGSDYMLWTVRADEWVFWYSD